MLFKLMFLGLLAFSASPSLKDIAVKTDADAFISEFTFSGATSPLSPSVEYIRSTIQLDFSGVDFPQGKKNVRVNQGDVQSVSVYKNGNRVRVRIILHDGVNATLFRDRLQFDQNGDAFTVKVIQKPIVTDSMDKLSDDEIVKAAQGINAEASAKANEATEKKATQDEAKIPIHTAATEIKRTSGSSNLRLILGLCITLGLAGGLMLFGRRWIERSAKNKKQTQIKVLTQHYLGPRKSLAIVRVAGESILIGVTDHNISMIKALSLLDEEIPQDIPSDFSQSLKGSETQQAAFQDADTEDFSFKKMRDVVRSKMGKMKEL